MELTFFSLLYPSEQSQKDHFSGKYCPDIDMYTLDELGLLEAFDLKNSKIEEYFTIDPTVMRYRNEMFADMLRYPELGDTLSALMPVLSDMNRGEHPDHLIFPCMRLQNPAVRKNPAFFP